MFDAADSGAARRDSEPRGGIGDSAVSEQGIAVRKAAMITIAVGIVHSLLLLSAFALLKMRAPSTSASDAEIIAFYSDANERRIVLVAGIYLLPFAALAFIWFTVALRMWAAGSVQRINTLFANVQLVSGIVYITLLLAAGASLSVLATSAELSSEPINPELARQFPQFGVTLFLVLAMRMAAMFVFTTSSLLRGAGLLPRWFVFSGAIVGLSLLLSASLNSWLVVIFPGWILVLCAILLNQARKIPGDLVFPEQDIGDAPRGSNRLRGFRGRGQRRQRS